MICFENNREYLLQPADYTPFEGCILPLLEEEEQVLLVCQAAGNGMVFTNRRVIAVDVQGMLGTQTDVCSLFFRSVQGFASDRADGFSTLELFLAGHKQVRFRFEFPDADLSPVTTAISRFTL